jgi:hypothetical protein
MICRVPSMFVIVYVLVCLPDRITLLSCPTSSNDLHVYIGAPFVYVFKSESFMRYLVHLASSSGILRWLGPWGTWADRPIRQYSAVYGMRGFGILQRKKAELIREQYTYFSIASVTPLKHMYPTHQNFELFRLDSFLSFLRNPSVTMLFPVLGTRIVMRSPSLQS